MNTKHYFVYMLASKKNGVIYIGVTNDLVRRIYEHKNNIIEGFTSKYKIYNLVYYEIFEDAMLAIEREKCVKRWKRSWKIELIEEANKNWQDLYRFLLSQE